MKRSLTAIAVSAAAFVSLPAFAATVDQVKSRGYLVCGSNPGLPGFGLPDDQGHASGFGIDSWRAAAGTIVNHPNKVRCPPLTAKDRFTALQSGEIDVLARNTTW